MLPESLLARSSRSLLSGTGVRSLRRRAFQDASQGRSRVQTQLRHQQQRQLAGWVSFAIASAEQPEASTIRSKSHLQGFSAALQPNSLRQVRTYASRQSNGGENPLLWPVRYVLENLFRQQQVDSAAAGDHMQRQAPDGPKVGAAQMLGGSLQHGSSRGRSAVKVHARGAGASQSSGDATGQAAPSQRVDTSGSNGGPPEAQETANGAAAAAADRTLQELTAAADWQLQRAYAELRRGVEQQASGNQEQRRPLNAGSNGRPTNGRTAEGHAVDVGTAGDRTSARGSTAPADTGARAAGSSTINRALSWRPSLPLMSPAPPQPEDEQPSRRQQQLARQQRKQEAAEAADAAAEAGNAPPARERGSSWVRLPTLPVLPSLRRSRQQPVDQPPVQLTHPAVQLAWRRAKGGSRPGARTDGAKLGLVVEGGGMRGVVSAGSLMMLYELGLKDAFDAVYGASAGAINATYFLTGQREGADIYAEDISNKTFCDLARLVGRHAGPVLDLSFLIDHVMMEVKPLRWHEVISSNVPLKVVASCLDKLGPVVLTDFADREDLARCLKASANIPVIAGAPLNHRGRRLVDGAVFEAIPFRQAIADGCTHVVVLCTRPPFRGGRLQKAVSSLLETGVKRGFLNPDYMQPAWKAELDQLTREQMSADDLLVRALHGDSRQIDTFYGAAVAPLYPRQDCHISPVCIDPPTLRQGMAEGRRLAAATFDPEDAGIPNEVNARLAPEVRAAIQAAGPQPSPFSQQPQGPPPQ